jgi:hypothetical protein
MENGVCKSKLVKVDAINIGPDNNDTGFIHVTGASRKS